jgi:ribonuclease P protein component
MLSRRKRLRAHEVGAIIASGRSARGTHLSVKFLPASTSFRAAVVVPKSLARKAHDRNRLRRAAYRALADLSVTDKKGTAVFFVRTIPQGPLAPAFASDLAMLVSKI